MIIFCFVIVLIVLQLSWDIPRTYFLLKNTDELEAQSVPFSRIVSNAPMRILVLGDSTAVGTGSARPGDSTAGRLGALYPNAEVVNLAVNGLKIGGLLKILASMEAEQNTKQHFDIVLIQIGANDIIKLTPMKNIDDGIAQVLTIAKGLTDVGTGATSGSTAGVDVRASGKVILLHSGDIGQALFFPWYLRAFYSHRSYEVRDIYEKEARAHGAQYVDLIDSPAATLLEQDPGRYYADDFLHLNGEGYGLWFAEIKRYL
jgi:lysophospholipase L1-like esterase